MTGTDGRNKYDTDKINVFALSTMAAAAAEAKSSFKRKRSLVDIIPPGGVFPYVNSDDPPPPGYLLCDGSDYSRNDYPDLSQKIGSKFGGTSTTFRVPDLRDMFVRDTGTNRVVGTEEGDRIKVHKHKFESPDTLVPDTYATRGFTSVEERTTNSNTFMNNPINETFEDQFLDNLDEPGFSSEMRPKNLTLAYIIKY
jgi:microcystin-dependent protein